MFPVKVTMVTMLHVGGTKYYGLVRLEASNGEAISIHRWGKVGAIGGTQVLEGNSNAARADYDKMVKKKEGRGYFFNKEDARTVHDMKELADLGVVGERYDIGRVIEAVQRNGQGREFFSRLANDVIAPPMSDDAVEAYKKPMSEAAPPPTPSSYVDNDLYGAF